MDAPVAVVVSGKTAEKHSGPADLMGLSAGEAEVETAHELSIPIPPEHPRVTRLRHRRLIAFLRDEGFRDSYKELMNKTRSHMSLGHLRGLVKRGRWVDAVEYLDRYLPPPTSPKSYHAMVLRKFLLIHQRFANIAVKSELSNYLRLNHGRGISHGNLRIRSILFSILASKEVRANINSEGVRDRASIQVSRLARSTPELRGCITLPAAGIMPHHVLPIASGVWSLRRYVKKKQTERPEAIVRALKSKQLMVPRTGSIEEAQELLADLLDESVQYGVQLNTYRLNRQIQPGRNEGAQSCQPTSGTSTEAKTYGTLANAGCHTNTAIQEWEVTELKRQLELQLELQRLNGSFGVASSADASVVFSGKNTEKHSGLADQVEDETIYKLCSETTEKRSGPMDDMGLSVGELSSPPEHPRVTRLRYRRLIAFLRDQGFRDSYKELTNKTRSHMSLGHLRGLVKRGRWVDAVEYLDRYLPPPTSPKSYPALVLRKFLSIHQRLANAADGIVGKSVLRSFLELNNSRGISHGNLRIRCILFPILAFEEVRVNMNWEIVRDRASIVVSRLARSTPELRGCIALPAASNKLHHVLPIASGLWSRRRYVKKKQTGQPEAIIRAMKSQQLMVPSIGSIKEAQELLADLLDESVQYGVQLNTYGLNRPLQPGTKRHMVEAGRHTNTASQGWAVNELERQLKRQRLIGGFGAFSEARPAVSDPGAEVNLGTKLSVISSG